MLSGIQGLGFKERLHGNPGPLPARPPLSFPPFRILISVSGVIVSLILEIISHLEMMISFVIFSGSGYVHWGVFGKVCDHVNVLGMWLLRCELMVL